MVMKSFSSTQIRNVALVGHGGAGKTSLGEAMLFLSGATGRLGKVDDQTSTLDFEPEEHKRRASIATAFAWMEQEGHKINLLDTPGDQNFIFDSLNALHGADAAVVVVSAPDGVEVQTERMWHEAARLGLPRAVFINKMDRDRADAATCIQDLKDSFGIRPVPVQVPFGAEHGFRGVISLFQRKALIYDMDGSGRYTKTDIPKELVDATDAAWENLVEAVAETDEDLLEKYLDTFQLSLEETRAAFQKALKKGEIVPVLFGAAPNGVGALALLELITWAFPNPLERQAVQGSVKDARVQCKADGPFLARVIHTHVDEFSGKTSILRVFAGEVPEDNLVDNASTGTPERLGTLFAIRGKDRQALRQPATGDIFGVPKLKNTHTGDSLNAPGQAVVLDRLSYPPPMMAYAITPDSKGDADKVKSALERLLEEDPTLTVTTDALTHHLVLNGMGQAHLDMALERMQRKYKVNLSHDLPPVAYRETLAAPVRQIEGKHKKQTGGAGQFGQCLIHMSPQARGAGFLFEDHIKGGSIPNAYIPSVEKGILNRMKSGFLAGYPIVDIKVELVDGKYHPVDSKDVAFQMAGSKALKAAFAEGGTTLLEPIMDIEVSVPTDVMGDILGDLTSRRGRITGMDPRGRTTVIKGQVPLVEVQRYAPDLKSMSAGKGSFTLHLAGYEELPRHLVDKVVAASPFKRAHEDDE